MRWERGLKIGAIVATAAVAVGLAQIMDAASLPWGIGLLAALGALLWYSAGCLTRRASFMDLRYLWPPLLLCIALGPLILALVTAWIDGRDLASGSLAQGLRWAWPWAIPLVLSLVLPRLYSAYRQRRVESPTLSSSA